MRKLLADKNVVATLLPSAAFFLKLGRYAPARMLIDHGVPVALASDLNPGGGFTTSMPFAMTLACFGMHLTLEEALVGATLNAAASIDRADRIGSLEVGKQLDAVIVDGMLTDLIRVGGPVVRQVDQTRPRRLRARGLKSDRGFIFRDVRRRCARGVGEFRSNARRRHGVGDRGGDGDVAARHGDGAREVAEQHRR